MNPLTHPNRLWRSAVWAGIILVLINLFNTLFLYQRTTSEISVAVSVRSDFDTWVWMAHRSLEQDSVVTHDRLRVESGSTQTYFLEIPPTFRLDNVSLFWNYSEQGQMTVESIKAIGSRKERVFDHPGEVVTYASQNVIMKPIDGVLSFTSETNGNGWVMMDTEKIGDLSKTKTFAPLAWWLNLLLAPFLVLFLYRIGFTGTIRTPYREEPLWLRLRLLLLQLWLVVLPFWLISSHTFLAVSLLFMIIHGFNRGVQLHRSTIWRIAGLMVLFLSMVMSDLFFHLSSLSDTLSRYLYFALTPFAFLSIPYRYIKLLIQTAAVAVSIYLSMIVLGSIAQWIALDAALDFSLVLKEIVEVRWHSSYLSACVLIPLLLSFRFSTRKVLFVFWFAVVLVILGMAGARLPVLLGMVCLTIIMIAGIPSVRLRQRLNLSLVLLGLVTVALVATQPELRSGLEERLLETETEKSDARLTLWHGAVQAIGQYPWTGVGRDQIPATLSEYIPAESDIRFRRYNAHNQYLEYALGYGLPVALLFMVVLVLPARRSGIAYRTFAFYFFLAMMVETYFTRQSGVVLFTFWFALLTFEQDE